MVLAYFVTGGNNLARCGFAPPDDGPLEEA
jgi:hypothetical protein